MGEEGFKKQPIGLGPYKFVGFQPGVELVVEANAQHWRKVPQVPRLIFKVVPERPTRLAMVKTGEADISYVEVHDYTQNPVSAACREYYDSVDHRTCKACGYVMPTPEDRLYTQGNPTMSPSGSSSPD